MRRTLFVLLGLALAGSRPAAAHIGSPDIYLDGSAGPYQLFITIRPPLVIPGVAQIEVRAAKPGIQTMRAVPLPMAGPGAKYAPVADKLTQSAEDPQLFTGSLWLMAPGSWQVRISADGAGGAGTIAVPVPSAAQGVKRMPFGLGGVLAILGLFLTLGVIAMAGASARESRLDPGLAPSPQRIRAGRVAMGVALLLTVAAVWGGDRWWAAEAASYGADVYKPLHVQAELIAPQVLDLKLSDPGWLNDPDWAALFTRSVDDLIPDHGHLMHLYVLREPALDRVYHLHPRLDGPGDFHFALPSMAAGDYRLYADIVHANGFPETLVASLSVPAEVKGRALASDDAFGSGAAWNKASATTTSFMLPDRYRMSWVSPPQVLKARQPVLFRFALARPDGSAPGDMAFYMGMLGHAAFVKTDGSVFAHIHPSGSVSMAALMLAQHQQNAEVMDMSGMSMGDSDHTVLPNTVAFPYGFPAPGRYRIFVQMKHGETVETGIFDAFVT